MVIKISDSLLFTDKCLLMAVTRKPLWICDYDNLGDLQQ